MTPVLVTHKYWFPVHYVVEGNTPSAPIVTFIWLGGRVRVEQEEVNTRETWFSRDPWHIHASLYSHTLFCMPPLPPEMAGPPGP